MRFDIFFRQNSFSFELNAANLLGDIISRLNNNTENIQGRIQNGLYNDKVLWFKSESEAQSGWEGWGQKIR